MYLVRVKESETKGLLWWPVLPAEDDGDDEKSGVL